MTFSIKYRKKDGSLDFIEVDAESRSAAFSTLKDRGITPIKVEEGTLKDCGWNCSKPGYMTSSSGCGKSSSVFKYILAGLLFVALAVGGFLWFCASPSSEKSDIETPNAKIVDATSAKVQREKPQEEKERVKPKSVEEALAKLEAQPKPEIKRREISPEEWDRLTNRTFKTGTEQLMSWVFSVEVGDMPMPIPPISEEDRQNITAILMTENPINENDSEMTKICKEQVTLAKKEMAKYLEEGGDPDDFLQYYFQELKSAFELRNDALDQLRETYEEDPELAEEVLEAFNNKFAEEGIKQINMEEIE